MSLNKILLLSEDQLLKLLADNGFEDISNILKNKHITGQKFLELSEIQAIGWKLSIPQQRNLFKCINNIKSNPLILFKETTVTKTKPLINKPKPTFSITPKPIEPTNEPKLLINNPNESNLFKKTLKSKTAPIPIESNNKIFNPKPLIKQESKPTKVQDVVESKPLPPLPNPIEESPKPKPKPFLPEPVKVKNISKINKQKLRPGSPKLEYNDIENHHPSDDYLLPNEINDPENNYEPPPKINNNNRQKLPLPQVSDENKELKSVVVDRPPVSIPKEDNLSEDEMNDYEAVPNQKLNILKSNIEKMGGYLNLENTEQLQVNSSVRSKKYSIEDLTNIIVLNEDGSGRSNNFLGKINKFFLKSNNKTPMKNNFSKESYENHMLKSEISTGNIPNPRSFINRPLPEIPSSPPSSPIRTNFTITKPKKIEPESKSPIAQRSTAKKSNTINNSIPFPKHNTLRSTSTESSRNRSSNQNTEELPEYENNQSIKNSASSSQRNSVSPLPDIQDQLALKLSEALKQRSKLLRKTSIQESAKDEEDTNQPVYGNVDDVETAEKNSDTNYTSDDNQPIYGNIDEDEGDEEDMEPDDEDEDYLDSIFNINNEKFYRNTDRKGAKQLLGNLADGAFLFRPSEKYFLVLTLKYRKKFYNLGIERTKTNKIRLNADSCSVSPEFGTLRGFVNYFQSEAVTFRDGDNLIEVYLNPVLPADVF